LEGGKFPRPGSGGIACRGENQASTPKREKHMTVLWIIIMVVAVAAIVWLLSRRRSRA